MPESAPGGGVVCLVRGGGLFAWSRGVCKVWGGAWSGRGVCLVQGGGVSGPGGGGVPGPGGVWSGGLVCLVRGVCLSALWDTTPPPVNRMTNRCKNITLATTSLRPVKIFVGCGAGCC